MGPAQRSPVAHHQRPGAVREEQALVRVQGDRVGPFDAAHDPPAALGEEEEAAVGRVDVKPQPLRAGEGGKRRQVVHRAGVGGPRGAHHQERRPPRRAVGGDGRPQCFEVQAEPRVGSDGAHVLRWEAGQHRRLLDRVMHLVRGVEHTPEEVLRQALATSGDDRREVGQRAAAGEQPQRARGIADDVAEPAADVGLQLHQGRSGGPDAHVTIDGVRDEVG